MNSFENITQRRTRTRSLAETTFEKSSLYNSTLDGSTNSLPNMSDDESDETKDLKRQVEKLKLDLLSAHEEINVLSIENSSLKSSLIEITNKCELLKKTAKMLTTDVGSPNSKTRKLSTPFKHLIQQTTVEDVTSLEKYMANSGRPTSAKKGSKNIQHEYAQEPQDLHNSVTPEVPTLPTITNRPLKMSSEIRKQEHRKICMISSNNVNKILDIGKSTFAGYKFCHYIIPNGGIKQLFANLDNKLKNFTHDDYCIIYIGERDFEVSNNYRLLIDYIKKELVNVMNTNIVICSPNFKLSNNFSIFNKRIEMFNHLMYLDKELWEYAYLFDSNYCVEYTFEMFRKYIATVNNKAVAKIFKNLMEYIKYLGSEAKVNEVTCHSRHSFDYTATGDILNQPGNNNNKLYNDQSTQTESTPNNAEHDFFRL